MHGTELFASLRGRLATFSLKVVATDSGVPARSSVMRVTVHVFGSNPGSFAVDEYLFFVYENSSAHSDIGQVSVIDQSDDLVYSVDDESKELGYFLVNPVNGLVSTSQAFDREGIDRLVY